MPKVNRGGKRSTGTSAFSFRARAGSATPQQAQDIIDTLSNEDSVSYDQYMTLSDDEKADAIATLMNQGVPDFLDPSMTQKLLYYTELDGKPLMASDSAVSQMNGASLYRTVHDYYNQRADVNYTAKEIYDQLTKGDQTAVSGQGGSAYGKGIYFAESYTESRNYRSTRNNNLTLRAKLNNNARVVSYSQASNAVRSEINKGTKLGRMYSRMNSDDRTSVWALNNGYNVVRDNYSGYNVILDRRAMTVSTRTVNPARQTRW